MSQNGQKILNEVQKLKGKLGIVGDLKEVSNQQKLKNGYRAVKDVQDIRIKLGQRITAIFYSKLGFESSDKKLNDDTKTKDKVLKAKLLQLILKDFDRLTDGIAFNKKEVEKIFITRDLGLITAKAELEMIQHYKMLLDVEQRMFKDLEQYLNDNSNSFPIWEWMRDYIPGVGASTGAALIASIDIHKASTAGKMMAYVGIDVVHSQNDNGDIVGKARSNIKEHLIDRSYIDKNGEEKTKKSITYNPILKSMLLGVTAGNMLMQAKRGESKGKINKYRYLYDNYKNRINHRIEQTRTDEIMKQFSIERKEALKLAKKEYPKDRINKMANRYMIKNFIIDCWKKWRQLEGLEITPAYHEKVLGIKHNYSEMDKKFVEVHDLVN